MFRDTLIALSVITLPTLAAAQFTGPSEGAQGEANTVAELKEAVRVDTSGLGGLIGTAIRIEQSEDIPFSLVGRLTGRVTEDIYNFRDETGAIEVEIHDAVFAGRPVSPENTIRISGYVDYSELGVGLEVSSFDIVR